MLLADANKRLGLKRMIATFWALEIATLSLFLLNTNVAASERSITGETLVSEVSILIPSVNDLLLGKLVRRLISFTLDATILGVDNSFLVLKMIQSYV